MPESPELTRNINFWLALKDEELRVRQNGRRDGGRARRRRIYLLVFLQGEHRRRLSRLINLLTVLTVGRLPFSSISGRMSAYDT